MRELWRKVHWPSPQPLSQRERGLEKPFHWPSPQPPLSEGEGLGSTFCLDGNWWSDIAPTSPSPSGRGARGEGKNAEGKKQPSIPPNTFENTRYLNQQGIGVVGFRSNHVLEQTGHICFQVHRLAAGEAKVQLSHSSITTKVQLSHSSITAKV